MQKNKTSVLALVERYGKLKGKTVENVQSPDLTKEIVANVKESESFYTYEWLGNKVVSRIHNHSTIKNNEYQYVNSRVHTNTIEGFWSLLKRGIFVLYPFTSKKHLQMYVDEFVFRYNTRDTTEAIRFNLLLSNSQNRLTYKELIG